VVAVAVDTLTALDTQALHFMEQALEVLASAVVVALLLLELADVELTELQELAVVAEEAVALLVAVLAVAVA
jgi:hypothetical protein